MKRLDLQIAWLFEEAQKLAPSRQHMRAEEEHEAALLEPLESIRRAYRAKQVARGLCASCSAPLSLESSRYCPVHLEKGRERARRSWRRANPG